MPKLSKNADIPSEDLAASRPKPSDSYVQSFARGLAVLRSFGVDAPAQTLSEVAKRSELSRAGARRILLTLLHLGYVEADERLFRLTPKVLDLGFAYLSSLPVWTQAQPVMEDLVQSLKQNCSASVLDGDEIVYILRIPDRNIMSINLSIGSRLPAYCTSMGRVLLAGLPRAMLKERITSMSLTPLTPHTIVDRVRLLEVIEQVRIQGWCMVSEELEQGLVSVAVPITDRNGNVVAAMNISGSLNKPTPADLLENRLPKLLAAATKINKLLYSQT